MSLNNDTFLTIATFFNLLIQASKPHTTTTERKNGSFVFMSDFNILGKLLSFYNEGIEMPAHSTARTDCTNFKKGKICKSSWIRFDNQQYKSSFLNSFNHDYDPLLGKFNIFLSDIIDYKDKDMISFLCNSLVTIIIDDKTISNDQIFYISGNQSSYKKQDMASFVNKTVYFQKFLLGIFKFLIERDEDCEKSKITFNKWYEKSGKRYKFLSNNIKIYDNKLNIQMYSFPDKKESNLSSIKSEITKDTLLKFPLYNKYKMYIEKETNNLKNIKTILNPQRPIPFMEMYVPQDLKNIVSTYTTDEIKTLKGEEINFKRLFSTFGNCLCVTAPAGCGKSMFMRYLFFNEMFIENNTNLIMGSVPIFFKIAHFSKEDSLIDLLFNKIAARMEIDFDDFLYDLENGGFTFLLDGLDEVGDSELALFYNQLELLTLNYSKNNFVISSRPFSNFRNLNKFNVLRLDNLSNIQRDALIYKFPNCSKEKKEKFINYLNKTIKLQEFPSFFNNPLILSLMFLIFLKYDSFPLRKYEFFKKTFDVLFEEHEQSKGNKTRILRTNLSKTEFFQLLIEFCFYSSDIEPIEFDELEISNILKRCSIRNIKADDFIFDMKNNLNLFIKENGKYKFIHQLFHECYCSIFLSKLDNKSFSYLDSWFEKLSNVTLKKPYLLNLKGLEIMEFLLEIDKTKTQELLIKPFIKKLFTGPSNDNFINFLNNAYTSLNYGFQNPTFINGHLLKIIFTINHLDLYVDLYPLNLPEIDMFKDCGIYTLITYINEHEHFYESFTDEELDSYLKRQSKLSPNMLGITRGIYNDYLFKIPVNTLIENNDINNQIIDILKSKYSPLYFIYTQLKQRYDI